MHTPNGKHAAEKSSVLKESDTLVQDVNKPEQQLWFHSFHSASLLGHLHGIKFIFRLSIMSALDPPLSLTLPTLF